MKAKLAKWQQEYPGDKFYFRKISEQLATGLVNV